MTCSHCRGWLLIAFFMLAHAVAGCNETTDPVGRLPGGSLDGDDLQPPTRLLLVPVPNPFSASVLLNLDLPEATRVRLWIADPDARVIRGLADERLPAGRYRYRWDGRDDQGARAPAGVYVARLTAGGAVISCSMTLVR
jgi:hypothetical protein